MFKPGVSGTPGGRKKGSYGGRIMALAALDRVLARKENRKLLIDALEEDFRKNPAHFFKSVIVPLLPKESKLSFDHSGPIVWTSLLEFGPGVETNAERGTGNAEPGVGNAGSLPNLGPVIDVTAGSGGLGETALPGKAE